MRPKPIIWFERALLLAVAIDLINNVLAIPTLKHGMAVRGYEMSPLILALAVVVAPGLGLVFWYCIARRASVIAKWLMTAFVALAVFFFFRQMIETPLVRSGNPMLMAAVIAELLKIYAVVCLFLPAARPWFGEEINAEIEEEIDE
jgi:hypothetical protein